jgi:hypothetical protein
MIHPKEKFEDIPQDYLNFLKEFYNGLCFEDRDILLIKKHLEYFKLRSISLKMEGWFSHDDSSSNNILTDFFRKGIINYETLTDFKNIDYIIMSKIKAIETRKSDLENSLLNVVKKDLDI